MTKKVINKTSYNDSFILGRTVPTSNSYAVLVEPALGGKLTIPHDQGDRLIQV